MIEVEIEARSIDGFSSIVPEDELRATYEAAVAGRAELGDRIVWNVNSTAVGGGVAEMIGPLLSYARGLGIDTRWLVIDGTPEFFQLTKRLHNGLHGLNGGSVLLAADRELYESVLARNARKILQRVRRGDVVVLHDPQTAGLAPALLAAGALVIWRCHIGTEDPNIDSERAWHFLAPFLREVPVRIFSRERYVPAALADGENRVIQPSIDAFSPKNQELDPEDVRAILAHVGVLEGAGPEMAAPFTRRDGSRAAVEHHADVIRCGRAPGPDTPLVVQVSRWDRLKDPVGVLRGFAAWLERSDLSAAALVLAGPNVHAVADDPEGDVVFREVLDAWRGLPHHARSRVTLASLPTHDVEENAVIVNALQRHATVVVQKSLREGFGLVVAEAMWKRRPVIASGVGGILDQIEDGVSGILLRDPRDPLEFSRALQDLLGDPRRASELGEAAHERVRERFLTLRHLREYHELLASALR